MTTIPPALTTRNPADENAIEVRWVWDRRIPVGGTTLLAGPGGYGKTLFAVWIMARLTRGELPGAFEGRPVDVVYVGGNDDRSTVLVPRLVAAGADLHRVHFVDVTGGAPFSVDALDVALTGHDAGLVVVDPLDSHLGDVDSHKKAEVQAAVARLDDLAQERRLGILGLAHLNKAAGADVLARVVGSVGFTTAARSVLTLTDHPDDHMDRVVTLVKARMTDCATVPTIRFRASGATIPHPDGGSIDTGLAVILGEDRGVEAP